MAADINTVIDVFSAQRLLVLGKDSVEISHDALLQAWKQLRDWLGDDQLDRVLYGEVITDAAAWDSSGRDSSYLYRPGRLAALGAAITRWQDAPTRYPPCRPPLRRSSTPLTTPPGATPGGGGAPSRSSSC